MGFGPDDVESLCRELNVRPRVPTVSWLCFQLPSYGFLWRCSLGPTVLLRGCWPRSRRLCCGQSDACNVTECSPYRQHGPRVQLQNELLANPMQALQRPPSAPLTACAALGQGKLAARNSRGGRQSRYCLRIELVQRQTVMHYQAARSRSFLRIVVATPNLVAQARGVPRRRATHQYPFCCTCPSGDSILSASPEPRLPCPSLLRGRSSADGEPPCKAHALVCWPLRGCARPQHD